MPSNIALRSAHNAFAQQIFAGVSRGYDRWAEIFSLFQYRRWHRALIAALEPKPGAHILDVSTGTGAVAFDLVERGCSVVGFDLSREMLDEACWRMPVRLKQTHISRASIRFVQGRAENLPFPDMSFDAVTFTFLVRYVADPLRPIEEIARVLRPGGKAAMLEFAIPRFPITRALWSLYVSTLLPLLTRPVSPGWATIGDFLGGSISEFYQRYPLSALLADWKRAGFHNLDHRFQSLGGAIVVTGEKE